MAGYMLLLDFMDYPQEGTITALKSLLDLAVRQLDCADRVRHLDVENWIPANDTVYEQPFKTWTESVYSGAKYYAKYGDIWSELHKACQIPTMPAPT